ncbi:hypothetical protein M5W84_21470, partial [Paenibacillus thiaminolyticus]
FCRWFFYVHSHSSRGEAESPDGAEAMQGNAVTGRTVILEASSLPGTERVEDELLHTYSILCCLSR